MWYRLEQLSSKFQYSLNQMDSDQWVIISVVAVVIGALFLKGFGSRTSY